VSGNSAGLGTRQNIDEFTRTTARSLEIVGGAKKGKAIIVLNPAEPPITMQNTVYAMVDPMANAAAIVQSIGNMVVKIQQFVPGYRLKHEPDFDKGKITVMLQVEGAGDYFPKYSGNLDIITSAAVATAEAFVDTLKI
jgi:acetaldehyde dehydrogenase